jgi:hypothetical protein
MKTTTPNPRFQYLYKQHCSHLNLQGLRAKTIDAYTRAIRRIGAAYDCPIESITRDQLLDHFSNLSKRRSKSTVKLDLYGLKLFYLNLLERDWVDLPIIKSSRVVRIPDIVSIEEAQRLFSSTQVLSYRVFFYSVYSNGITLKRRSQA